MKPVITAEDVAAKVPIPEGAILTPLAQDLLRKRGQAVEPFERHVAWGAVALRRGSGPPAPRGPLLVPLVVANWKSYKTTQEAREFARRLAQSPPRGRARAVICPPFTALHALASELGDAADLGAQDVSPFEEGAHTGEVAARHLAELGCRWAIVGHSERRAERGEDDALARRKVRAALAHGVSAILCVGETLEEREAGRTSQVVRGQLRAVLDGFDPARSKDLVVAYEPRWAIGRGVTPRDDEIVSAIADAHSEVERALGARGLVLYGGSVAGDNARRIFALPGVGGGLVGGASLNADSFVKLVAAAG